MDDPCDLPKETSPASDPTDSPSPLHASNNPERSIDFGEFLRNCYSVERIGLEGTMILGSRAVILSNNSIDIQSPTIDASQGYTSQSLSDTLAHDYDRKGVSFLSSALESMQPRKINRISLGDLSESTRHELLRRTTLTVTTLNAI